MLITGCSSGIGRTTALRLAAAGRTVYATARRPESIEDLVAEGCRTLTLDVTDEASMRAAVERVEAEQGAVGALVNNAGYSQSGPIEETPIEEVRAQFETNVFGLSRLCQLVLPGMRRAGGGRIVNVGSMGGRLTFPGGGYYHATKYALEAITDALRFEVEGFGIDVALIQPGLIRTNFSKTVSDKLPKAREGSPYARFNAEVDRITREAYQSGVMGRLTGEAEDVAAAIAKALDAPRPKTRYPVTLAARLLMLQRALSPDRWWDAFLARTYPRPG